MIKKKIIKNLFVKTRLAQIELGAANNILNSESPPPLSLMYFTVHGI